LAHLVGGGAIFCTFVTAFKQAALAARTAATSQRRPLVVLDPGHGGRDPGTTGIAGTLEKHVTLASALALRTLLETHGYYRVALTRARDQYVHLDDRVAMARHLGASLFLSLHADRLADPAVRGASVYTVSRIASDAETAALARRENGQMPVADQPMPHVSPEVSRILASLTAHRIRAASTRMAHEIIRGMRRDLPVLNTPERHADFTVLHAPDIPSVLIEMGFLSNTADETALNDPAHRELIAHAMLRAIDSWFAGRSDTGPA
jgi:N-acetylmuramoyl-L-alanine amidase